MREINRPEWDEIWMKMAETISLRSHHPKWKVGAIIVTSDNTQVLSLGYNGNAAGLENCPDSMSPGKCGMIHAEINALLKLDYNNPKEKKMYVTLSPCEMCAKAIVNSGVKTVIYKKSYRNSKGVNILRNSGIIIRKV